MSLGRQILQINAPIDYRNYILKIISILILFYYLFFAELANCETTYYTPDGTMVTKEEFVKISKDYSNKASTKQTMANNLKSIEDKNTKINPKKITNDTSQRNSVDNSLRRMSEQHKTDSRYNEQARIRSEADQNKASFREEYKRELRKKFVHDAVYGERDYPFPLPPLDSNPAISPQDRERWKEQKMKETVKDAVREERQNSPPIQIPESSVMQEWKMKNAVREEMQRDRLMQPYKSKYR